MGHHSDECHDRFTKENEMDAGEFNDGFSIVWGSSDG
jgi:hypothetical protein